MPNNTLVTMDDLTDFTTGLKTILDTSYSGGGSGSGSSGGSNRIYSTKTKISQFINIDAINSLFNNCMGLGEHASVSDISNNADCCSLYKEGNLAFLKITNGLQLTIEEGSDVYSDVYMPLNFGMYIEEGFKPSRNVLDVYNLIQDPGPYNAYDAYNKHFGSELNNIMIDTNGSLCAFFSNVESLDNSNGGTPKKFILNINICYPLS